MASAELEIKEEIVDPLLVDQNCADKNDCENISSTQNNIQITDVRKLLDSIIRSMEENYSLLNGSDLQQSKSELGDNNNTTTTLKICEASPSQELVPKKFQEVKIELGKALETIHHSLKTMSDENICTNLKIALSLVLKDVLKKFFADCSEFYNTHFFIDFAIRLFEDSLKLRQYIPACVSSEIVIPITDFLLPIYDKAIKVKKSPKKASSSMDAVKYSVYADSIKSTVAKHRSQDIQCEVKDMQENKEITSEVTLAVKSIKDIFFRFCPSLIENSTLPLLNKKHKEQSNSSSRKVKANGIASSLIKNKNSKVCNFFP